MTNVILETIQPREFAARVVGYVLVLPLSLLMMLAVFRVIGGLKNAEHRTDAVLALLARPSALLPLVVNFLVGRCSRKSNIAVLCPSGPLAVVIYAAYGEAFGPRLSILGRFRKWGPSSFAKKGTRSIYLSEALPALGEYAAVVMWERNLLCRERHYGYPGQLASPPS